MRILVPLTDAYGAKGGIAQYNRRLLAALCAHPDVTEVVALPRNVVDPVGALPGKLVFDVRAAGDLVAFTRAALRALSGRRPDAVLCGHVNLLPWARLAATARGAPLALLVHGVEAWTPTRRPLVNALVKRVDAVAAVSRFTARRMSSWSGIPEERFTIMPGPVDLGRYGPAPRHAALRERLGLEGAAPVLLTMARLDAGERYKGVDEMLAVLPRLAERWPGVKYVVAGEGTDRLRLEGVARTHGVASRVVFTGWLKDDEKLDHLRLADVFVMPGRGEGLGIVYLEALACGVPVVASVLDGSREAVRDGELGEMADPDDPASIETAVARALDRPHGVVPEGLKYFDDAAFRARVHGWMRTFLPGLRA